jgi:transcriptional regulator with XRE-family HTH domain
MSGKTGIMTSRELEIAKLKAKGLLNREIAKQLDVSPEYVSQTLAGIMQKIEKVEDSIKLLEELSLVESGTRFRLSTKGKQLVGARRLQVRVRSMVTFDRAPKMDNLITRDGCNYCPLKSSLDIKIQDAHNIRWLYGISRALRPLNSIAVSSTLIAEEPASSQDVREERWETDKRIVADALCRRLD